MLLPSFSPILFDFVQQWNAKPISYLFSKKKKTPQYKNVQSHAGNLVTLTISGFKEIIHQHANFRFLPLAITSLKAPSCVPVRCFCLCTNARAQSASNLQLPNASSTVLRGAGTTISSQYWKIMHSFSSWSWFLEEKGKNWISPLSRFLA